MWFTTDYYCHVFAGIHAEIATARYEYWSSFAPLPVEVVLAAGQKAKDENSFGQVFPSILSEDGIS